MDERCIVTKAVELRIQKRIKYVFASALRHISRVVFLARPPTVKRIARDAVTWKMNMSHLSILLLVTGSVPMLHFIYFLIYYGVGGCCRG